MIITVEKRETKLSDFMTLQRAARNCLKLVTHGMGSTWLKEEMPRQIAALKWLIACLKIPLELKVINKLI